MTKPKSPGTQASSQSTEGHSVQLGHLQSFALRESELKEVVHLEIDSIRRGPHVPVSEGVETSTHVHEHRVYVAPKEELRRMFQDLIDRLDELS